MELSLKANLEGKVAVVTGGAGVLCKEFAKALAMCGAKVAVAGRTLSKVEAVAAEICAMGGEAIGVQMNVVDKESVKAAHEEVLAKYGKCDILINGAGGKHPRATTDNEYFEDEMIKKYDPEKLTYGYNTLPDGEEIYYIPNPALGLWINKEKF